MVPCNYAYVIEIIHNVIIAIRLFAAADLKSCLTNVVSLRCLGS